MKYLINFILLFVASTLAAQTKAPAPLPQNWSLLDEKDDGYRGISLEKTYTVLLKDKKPKQQVIVAVIDVGVDGTHPDLKNALWTNKKEIAGNGIDDDQNGYIDVGIGYTFKFCPQSDVFSNCFARTSDRLTDKTVKEA